MSTWEVTSCIWDDKLLSTELYNNKLWSSVAIQEYHDDFYRPKAIQQHHLEYIWLKTRFNPTDIIHEDIRLWQVEFLRIFYCY